MLFHRSIALVTAAAALAAGGASAASAQDSPAPVTARAAQAPGPVVSGLLVRKRDNALRFSLSEAAGLRITIARRTRSGGYKTVDSIDGIPGDAGANTITHRLELTPGAYRAKVTAIAPEGAPASKTFTVKR